MGGGDLNLKKSWHPSTLRNIERVWKAEQKHEVEKQKIEQLQKELAEERAREEIQAYAEDQGVVRKKEERLDWMYQGPAAMVNREDYLLGRKIDKTLEMLEQQESGVDPKKDDFDIGATMFSSQDLSGTATVDLANKIREDPLFNIMKKEKEQKKNLLSNPVKMKQLQQMLQESLNKGKKKSKKQHSDSDIESKKHHKKHKKNKHSSKKNYLSSDDDDNQKKHQIKREKIASTAEDKSFRMLHSYHEDKPQRRMSSPRSHHDRNSSESRGNRSFLSRCDKYSSKDNKHNNQTIENYKKMDYYNKNRNSVNASKKILDEEERERRLREMQENAKWREEQREKKVRRYREEVEREEKISHQVDASDFIKPMLSKAASKGSLENRVKQKIFSIQRNNADMDKQFVRR